MGSSCWTKVLHLLIFAVTASLSRSQHVRIDFPGNRFFSFSADTAENLNPTPPRLIKAVSDWCYKERTGLSVKPEQCLQMVVKNVKNQLTEARTKQSAHPRAGQHGLTPRFFEIADSIFAPAFGTEQLGPLLHSLVRFHRPEHVVELGFGYTTPFIAQGLADNAANVANERQPHNEQRKSQNLVDRWFKENPRYETRRKLTVVDDQSQRDDDGGFGEAVAKVLRDLDLNAFVHLEPDMNLARAHTLFKPDSLGLVWNDAQWDPNFLRTWWPLVKKDGGLLLLHNVIGHGELSRWCVASPRRVMRELFPDEKFEFLTLQEPHKAYQGSVAMLRRLDPNKAPNKYGYLWGGKELKDGVRKYAHLMDALDRPLNPRDPRYVSPKQEQSEQEL